MTKIYTKKGDQGNTTLCSGLSVPKDNLRISALGSIDELNCVIGMVLSHLNSEQQNPPRYHHQKKHRASDSSILNSSFLILNYKDACNASLQQIQKELLEVGSEIALFSKTKIESKHIERLEQEIDNLNKKLPPLKKFILPAGNIAITTTHLARAVCRRAESYLVALSRQDEINPVLLQYMNRLSDLLFTTARILQLGE
jgi:cob(I)alamin adenosyltransferase